jgi:hypothetical protein
VAYAYFQLYQKTREFLAELIILKVNQHTTLNIGFGFDHYGQDPAVGSGIYGWYN